MSYLLRKLLTYYRLGLGNALHVLAYRLKLRNRHFVKTMPIAPPLASDRFFSGACQPNKDVKALPALTVFGKHEVDVLRIPDWHKSVISHKTIEDNTRHWSQLDDFSLNVGDIKGVWELSRMDWLLLFSINYLATGNSEHIDRLNQWLADWIQKNPCNQGVNWKCGQEASIRVIHLVLTAQLLQQYEQANTALLTIVEQHLQRIAPTLSYAKAQDNNHGTSEAAALFIGGLFLSANKTNSQYLHWVKKGRNLLENRVFRLIDVDGNFSQNSVNYHRLMLDTLSITEYFRVVAKQNVFSASFYEKAKQATLWLYGLVDETNGLAPNFGLNDGANLLPITPCDYRDFRSSVQFASLQFFNALAYPHHVSAEQLTRLFSCQSITSSLDVTKLNHRYQTGLAKLSNQCFSAFVRTHDGKFRPSACDGLHLDLWCDNKNIFIGTGSYSYNSECELKDYFNSTEAHNTVQFDGQQQMPKLSRFLYNDWLKCQHHQDTTSLFASYKNNQGHQHARKVTLDTDDQITIVDSVSGFSQKAQLRWHLADNTWQLNSNRLTHNNIDIEVACDVGELTVSLVEGWTSYYYAEKVPSVVLVIEVHQPCAITTTITRHLCG